MGRGRWWLRRTAGFWLGGQGAGNADALFLPAGELRRVFIGVILQADAGQQFADAGVIALRDSSPASFSGMATLSATVLRTAG